MPQTQEGFMKGIVSGHNAQRTRYAIQTDLGYTVADIEDGELNINDVVSGNLDDHGEASLLNHTTGASATVYVEAIQATESAARTLLQNR